MTSICTTCGQLIKNVVIISGNPYGTTCAERKLGIRLPFGFVGDYDKHIQCVYDIQNKLKADKAKKERYLLTVQPLLDRISKLFTSYDLKAYDSFSFSFLKSINESIIKGKALTEKQKSLFLEIENKYLPMIIYTEKRKAEEKRKQLFKDLIPMAKEKGWNPSQLREYVNTL